MIATHNLYSFKSSNNDKQCFIFADHSKRSKLVDALWSPAEKELTSWLSFVMSNCDVLLSHWYPGSGVVLDCIDS